MQYTAIIKDGGLFIPNVFADLNNDGTHIVQVSVDIAAVRQQLSTSTEPKEPKQDISKTTAPKEIAVKETKKPVKRSPKKEASQDLDLGTQRNGAMNELAALDDSELSEIFKAYMNDGQPSTQISLEDL